MNHFPRMAARPFAQAAPRLIACLACSWLLAAPAAAQSVAPNAPKDAPRESSVSELDRAIAPYVTKARATYPDAKRRFKAGLPRGQSFFLTTRLKDRRGAVEQVFIAVDDIRDGTVTGRIWSDIEGVQGYRKGQQYSFPEAQLLDWLITRPDGSEEGNYVGRFLDTYQPKR